MASSPSETPLAMPHLRKTFLFPLFCNVKSISVSRKQKSRMHQFGIVKQRVFAIVESRGEFSSSHGPLQAPSDPRALPAGRLGPRLGPAGIAVTAKVKTINIS